MAPSGFLVLLKVVIDVAGTGEHSFRFIPLLGPLLALPLFAKLARKCLSRPAMLLALGAFAYPRSVSSPYCGVQHGGLPDVAAKPLSYSACGLWPRVR